MAKYLDNDGVLYLWNKIKTLLTGKVDKVSGKGLSTNDYTTAEKTKLSGIATNANNYVHPNNASTRHVSDTQIKQWSENTKYTSDTPTVISVGGVPTGFTFDDMSVKDVFSKMFYPYVAPIVTVAGTPNGGVYEKGTTVSLTALTVNITKKSENITKTEIFNGSTSLGIKTDGGTGSVAFTSLSVPVTDNRYFTAKVTDASGTVTTANTNAFSFVYPFYQGIISASASATEAAIKALTKVIQAKGNKNFAYTATNQKMVIAYPKSYGALSKIIDPNQFDVTATWTRSEINVTTADEASTPYYVYVSNAVTVSSYKMQFNY